jgi:hypothetical protein
VLHSGKRRYGAPDVERGQQASLIMWTKSRSYRLTEAYARRCSGAVHDRRLIVVAPLDDQMRGIECTRITSSEPKVWWGRDGDDDDLADLTI